MHFLKRIPIGVWFGLVTLTIIVGGTLLLSRNQFLNSGDNQSENLLGELIESQGGAHIEPGSTHPAYNSNPPTSGWHWSQPAECQTYDEPVTDEAALHSLEHGAVWVSYQPDIGQEAIDQLQGVVKSNRAKVILAPRVANDSPIALVSWQRLLKQDSVDEGTIIDFIKTNRNNGPELAAC